MLLVTVTYCLSGPSCGQSAVAQLENVLVVSLQNVLLFEAKTLNLVLWFSAVLRKPCYGFFVTFLCGQARHESLDCILNKHIVAF